MPNSRAPLLQPLRIRPHRAIPEPVRRESEPVRSRFGIPVIQRKLQSRPGLHTPEPAPASLLCPFFTMEPLDHTPSTCTGRLCKVENPSSCGQHPALVCACIRVDQQHRPGGRFAIQSEICDLKCEISLLPLLTARALKWLSFRAKSGSSAPAALVDAGAVQRGIPLRFAVCGFWGPMFRRREMWKRALRFRL